MIRQFTSKYLKQKRLVCFKYDITVNVKLNALFNNFIQKYQILRFTLLT